MAVLGNVVKCTASNIDSDINIFIVLDGDGTLATEVAVKGAVLNVEGSCNLLIDVNTLRAYTIKDTIGNAINTARLIGGTEYKVSPGLVGHSFNSAVADCQFIKLGSTNLQIVECELSSCAITNDGE